MDRPLGENDRVQDADPTCGQYCFTQTDGTTGVCLAGVAAPGLEPMRRFPLRVWVVCSLLLLTVVLVFGQTFGLLGPHCGLVGHGHDFVFDDELYVVFNPQVRDGLTTHGVTWAFSHFYAAPTWLSHMLDSQIYRSGDAAHQLNPAGHHFTNVLLHAATAVLLFLVLRRMTGDFWPSALVAAVFAVHPLRVESVAWVAERKDVLSGLFFMLTLAAYAGYARRPFSLPVTWWWRLFALGLMAKPMLVTLPLVLLLLDYWPLGRLSLGAGGPARRANRRGLPRAGAVVEKIPFLALSAASACYAVGPRQRHQPREMSPGLADRQCAGFVRRLSGPVLLPGRAGGFLSVSEGGLPVWEFAGAVCCWRHHRRRCCAAAAGPYLLVGWLWYLGMLVPVIGLVQVGDAGHGRPLYLPAADRAVHRAGLGTPRDPQVPAAFVAGPVGAPLRPSCWRV